MKENEEKRSHDRIALRLSVVCQKVGLSSANTYTGHTVNVSPGGMLMEINSRNFNHGELLSVEMSVPPTEGLLEYGGRFSSYARIVRVHSPKYSKHSQSDDLHTVALEFCESPKLNI